MPHYYIHWWNERYSQPLLQESALGLYSRLTYELNLIVAWNSRFLSVLPAKFINNETKIWTNPTYWTIEENIYFQTQERMNCNCDSWFYFASGSIVTSYCGSEIFWFFAPFNLVSQTGNCCCTPSRAPYLVLRLNKLENKKE